MGHEQITEFNYYIMLLDNLVSFQNNTVSQITEYRISAKPSTIFKSLLHANHLLAPNET